jgi:hypothetical protein
MAGRVWLIAAALALPTVASAGPRDGRHAVEGAFVGANLTRPGGAGGV